MSNLKSSNKSKKVISPITQDINKTNLNNKINSNTPNKSYLNTISDFIKTRQDKDNRNANNFIKKELGLGQKVKSLLEDEFNYVALIILLVILLILVYLLYKNTFTKLSEKTKRNMKYYKMLDKINPNIEVCGSLDETEQYRLCDYYISSSYNTPCIGQPHFDYIDHEMYAKVLNSGARYIQLPICSRTVKYDTEPVVATAERGKNFITSLNTLELRTVLVTIRSYAFKYVKSSTINPKTGEDILSLSSSNYPLIIHLEINTNNVEVMNKASEEIKDILGAYILSPEKYNYYPISLEKLCNLSNKIIIIASGSGYESSLLSEIVISTRYCFRMITNNDIEATEKTDLNENELTDYFSKNVSYINQKNTYRNLEIIKDNLDEILNQSLKVQNNLIVKSLDDLFSNNSVSKNLSKGKLNNKFKNLTGETDLFTIYNMIGLTLVEPMTQDASISVNPNPFIAFTLGCQLIPMNFQLIDETMNIYINIFKKSSFVLKPSGLRLRLKEEDVEDIISRYGSINMNIPKLNIIPDFLFKNVNEYIVLQEEASSRRQILSHLKGGIITFINSKEDNRGVLQNITSNNVFKIVVSPLSNLNDCVMLVNSDNLAITVSKDFNISNNQISLEPIRKSIVDLRYQSFYPEIGVILEDNMLISEVDKTRFYVSFRLYNELIEGVISKPKKVNSQQEKKQEDEDKLNTNTYYLAFEKNKLRILNKLNTNLKLCTFSYSKVNTTRNIQLKQVDYGGVMVNEKSGIIYYANKKSLLQAFKFNITNVPINKEEEMSMSKLGKNFEGVVLRTPSGRLVISKNNSLTLDEEGNKKISKENIFYLGKENIKDDDYIIIDYKGKVLGINKSQNLEFMNENNPNLSNTKYFEIKTTFDSFENIALN